MLCRWGYNPAVSKAPISFEMSEATRPTTLRHILKDLNYHAYDLLDCTLAKRGTSLEPGF
jgi:hypothetical protein